MVARVAVETRKTGAERGRPHHLVPTAGGAVSVCEGEVEDIILIIATATRGGTSTKYCHQEGGAGTQYQEQEEVVVAKQELI
jgi:hypothetical protein